jgi:hypothetical protein
MQMDHDQHHGNRKKGQFDDLGLKLTSAISQNLESDFSQLSHFLAYDVVARSDWFEGGTRDISGPANKNATQIAYFFKEWPVSISS